MSIATDENRSHDVTSSTVAEAWRNRAPELTAHANRYKVNRRDVWGAYLPKHARKIKIQKDGKQKCDAIYTAPPLKDRNRVTLSDAIIEKHFRAFDLGHIIGLHAIGADNRCRWFKVDIDCHDGDGADPVANEGAAMFWYGVLVGRGFNPLLTRSDDGGGFHLTVIFAEPIDAPTVYQFGAWLVSDYADHGLAEAPETFPKQPELTRDKQFGNWMRLWGHHHTRDHWTQVFDGAGWAEGDEAIDLILSRTGDDVSLVKAIVTEMPEVELQPVTPPTENRLHDATSSHRNGNGRLSDQDVARICLGALDSEYRDNYHKWVDVGQILHDLGMFAEWNAWSGRSGKYVEGECAEKWKTFGAGTGKMLTLGSLVKWARECGTDPYARPHNGNGQHVLIKTRSADTAHDTPAADFELTEMGMAERVCDRHRGQFRYVTEFRKPIVWDGRRWRIDETGALDRLVKETIRATKLAASKMAGDYAKTLWNHAHGCESNSKIKAIIERIGKEPGVAIRADALNTNPDLLNTTSGTIELRTGELHEHQPDDLITKIIDIDYDPAATCSAFDKVLNRSFEGNASLINFVQRANGYSATGHTGERCLFMPWGGGANGKSTIINAIGAVMGEYATTLPAESLMIRRNESIPNDIARLKDARHVAAVECEEGRRLAESLVKQMTGGSDLLTARFLHGEFFSFKPAFKLWIGTNHKPIVRGSDEAIWDRIRLVPFNVRIPENERDANLPDKLKRERAGILAWIVRGAVAWYAEGLGAPAEVKTATQDYKSEMDTLGTFIEHACVEGENLEAGATDLYEAYRTWATVNGENPVTQTRFGMQLAERGKTSTRAKSGRKIWMGIGIAKSE